MISGHSSEVSTTPNTSSSPNSSNILAQVFSFALAPASALFTTDARSPAWSASCFWEMPRFRRH